MQKGEIWILKKENSDYAPEVKILELFETNIGKKQEMVKVKHMLNGLIAKHSGQDVKKAEADMERNEWMSAQEALEYGLIDKIIE